MAETFFTTPKMQPTVSHEKSEYVFRLWRNDEKVVHTFKDACVILSYGNEKSIPVNQLAKMNGPSYDGWTYHIYVQHHADSGSDETFIWLSKEEFGTLWPLLEGPEEEEDDPYATEEIMRGIMRDYA